MNYCGIPGGPSRVSRRPTILQGACGFVNPKERAWAAGEARFVKPLSPCTPCDPSALMVFADLGYDLICGAQIHHHDSISSTGTRDVDLSLRTGKGWDARRRQATPEAYEPYAEGRNDQGRRGRCLDGESGGKGPLALDEGLCYYPISPSSPAAPFAVRCCVPYALFVPAVP